MTEGNVKLLLILLAVGLIGALALFGLLESFDSALGNMRAAFEKSVTACQEKYPEWDRGTCEGIVRGDVWEGMSAAMLIASLGEPYEVDPSDLDPTREVWTYRSSTYGEELFYLTDGVIESWEQAPGCESCSPKPLRK